MQTAVHVLNPARDPLQTLRLQKRSMCSRIRAGIGEDAVSIVVADGVVYLPLEDLIDREKEIERLTKEQERLTKEIARCEGMLNNPNFVNKAPAAKVEAEKEKLEKYKEMKEKVNLQLNTDGEITKERFHEVV